MLGAGADPEPGPEASPWLPIEQPDEVAAPGSGVVAEHPTCAATGRTMDEIAAGARGRRSDLPTSIAFP